MYSVSRYLLYAGAASTNGGNGVVNTDYHNTAKLIDIFHPVYQRSTTTYDHVLVDVPSLITSVAHLTRDYVGHERDRETAKIVQRQLQTVLLRRVQPRKSLALLFDGCEPLWQLERTRLFPGRRYDSKFYRSCASPMPYLLEERIRGAAMELQKPPAETLISGPATPGLSEGKISAYLLDLATRILRLPSHPPHLCAAVTASDSVCVVGAPELALLGLGMTPFQNITTLTMDRTDLTSCSLQDCMEWMGLQHLLPPSLSSKRATITAAASQGTEKESDGVDQEANEHIAMVRRLSAVRTDLVFLYLLTNGHATTGLPQVLATPFANVLDAYMYLEEAFHNANAQISEPAAAGTNASQTKHCFRSLLFDEELVTLANFHRPALRLKVHGLLKVLVRVYKNTVGETASVPTSSKPTPHAATLLILALQTHGLLCSGGVPSPGWSPTSDNHQQHQSQQNKDSGSSTGSGTALLDKFPKIGVEQLIQHLSYLLTLNTPSTSSASSNTEALYLAPQRSRDFGLTGAEVLLMTATQPEHIQQLLPLYVRGHSLPDGVAEEIVSTRNVHAALHKTQQVMAGVVGQAEKELAALAAADTKGDAASESLAPHPALTHLPSHLFVRTPGSQGPPAGWAYYGVHLGIKAEAMNVRYSLNAADTATLHVAHSNGKEVSNE